MEKNSQNYSDMRKVENHLRAPFRQDEISANLCSEKLKKKGLMKVTDPYHVLPNCTEVLLICLQVSHV
jgi:hypothetical protein